MLKSRILSPTKNKIRLRLKDQAISSNRSSQSTLIPISSSSASFSHSITPLTFSSLNKTSKKASNNTKYCKSVPSSSSFLSSSSGFHFKREMAISSPNHNSSNSDSTHPDSPTIDLNETEEILCQLLEHVCHWISLGCPDHQGSGATMEPIECQARLAGGWVRDKLLASDSDDIDISLSTMTGHSFALKLKDFLASEYFKQSRLYSSNSIFHSASQAPADQQSNSEQISAQGNPGKSNQNNGALSEAKKSGTAGGLLSSIGKIEANPEQSKSLETATATLFGLSLDFVNLRKEAYEDGSRIPVMTFGTPEEDALRRDLTINALLYNVHTRKVEDWTGKGLSDLSNQVIRTPLPPLTTFLEDPLRVLRCVRFSSRLGWRLDQEIISVLVQGQDKGRENGKGNEGNGGEVIKEALRNKVSRERFGIEIDKMLQGPNPLLSIHLLIHLGLFSLVFHPTQPKETLMKTSHVVSESGSVETIHQSGEIRSQNLSYLAFALLTDLWNVARPESGGRHEVKDLEMKDGSRSSPDSSNIIPVTPPSSNLPTSLISKIPVDLLRPLESSESRRRLFLASALLPIRDLEIEELKGNGLGKWKKVSEEVILIGLKLPLRPSKDPVMALHYASTLLSNPRLPDFDALPERGSPRDGIWSEGLLRKAAVGLTLRQLALKPGMNADSLRLSLLFTLVCDLTEIWSKSSTNVNQVSALDAGQAGEIIDTHLEFWRFVEENHLIARSLEKARLDGNQIKEVLGFHPGPLTARIMESIITWQLCREFIPNSNLEELKAEMEECKIWLKAEWERGGIVPMAERQMPAKKGKGKEKEKSKKGQMEKGEKEPKNKKRRSQER